MDQDLAVKLLERYRAGTCTPEEKVLVEQWYLQLIETGEWEATAGQKTALMQDMETRLLNQINSSKTTVQVHRIHFLRRAGWWAAAAILVAVGFGMYFLLSQKQSPTITSVTPEAVKKDIKAPGVNKAVITLSNGQQVYLDQVSSGQLAQEGNTNLVKLTNGEIVYQASSGKPQQAQYNTISNPRGSQVTLMTLSDGSKVWLNAGSSITYPVTFLGSERKVEMSGEAYFEIAHDESKPFIVTKGETQVQVLGTHFNVNAYDDEQQLKVTLLEGKVNVNNTILKPGEQAVLTHDSRLTVHDNVDIEQVMAWKNNKFHFNRTPVEEIMKQLARWYDVNVNYAGKIPAGTYSGKISRNLSLQDLLDGLAFSNIKFNIEGKKLTIQP